MLAKEIATIPAGSLRAAQNRATAAHAAGIADSTGTLEPGKAADLVAMEKSPLDDISEVLRVKLVMRDGIVFLE